jgi:steroid delta-isomerase-like uncharacterized protein
MNLGGSNGGATGLGSGTPAAPEELLLLVRELLEAWNTHDPELIQSFYAPEYEGVDVGEAAPRRGPHDVAQTVERYLRAFPDLCFVEDDVVVQGDRAVLVWTARGTHGGQLMRIPPTGREISVRGTSVFTIRDGKITSGLHVWDVAGLLRSIGLLPDL